MPNAINAINADAAFIAAQTQNANLPEGVPPVPEGYVCVGNGGARLSSLRDITGLTRYPYAWEGGERPDWNGSGWSGNASHYLYAVTFDHFEQWLHVYVEGAPEAPERERLTLRVGGVYRRRDGGIVEIARYDDTASTYPYRTCSNSDYMSDGHYYNGTSEHSQDIVEEVLNPEPRVGITLVEGCYYQSREMDGRIYGPLAATPDGFKCLTTHREWDVRGFLTCGSVYETHNCDLTQEEVGVPVGMQLTGLNTGSFKSMVSLHHGYTGWRYLGTRVTKAFNHPWVYYGSSNTYGSIKSDDQALDGAVGHYFEMIPELPQDDSIESRKTRASDKAYGKFWLARATAVNKDIPYNEAALVEYLNNHVNTVARRRTDAGVICVSISSDPTMGLVLQYDPDTGLYKECTMTWGKIHSAVFADSTDESRRNFVHKLDTIRNESRVTIEWSTVRDTYCTPMAGWNCDDGIEADPITGSCMEKFCNDDGSGHEVFAIYKILERNDSMRMIKIYLLGDYVGRAVCWKSGRDNAWIMDRVYCRAERGEIPRDVVAELSKFAASNGIVARFHKCCVNNLPEVDPLDIKCGGLGGHTYYPYLDSYRGVSSSGLMADRDDCSIVCDDADGEPQDEYHEVYGRRGTYLMEYIEWSEYHSEYVHNDDVVYVSGVGAVHCDDTVEDYRGNSILREDSVALGPDEDEYAHKDDDDLFEVHFGNSRNTVYAIRA